ncbi:MAG: hypothetical protein IPM18_06970 [Phycisphaerales bacterium]|nr:hypothetical protein [Phycisphaerales bacterium]
MSPLQPLVERELEAGERLIWAHRPLVRVLSLSMVLPPLLALPWVALGVGGLWFSMRVGSGTSGGFAATLAVVCSLPALLIGGPLLAAPLWAVRRDRRTLYAITDRRAIVLVAAWRLVVRSYYSEHLRNLKRMERRDGSGDIVFERFTTTDSTDSAHPERRGFLSIRNVRQVEELLRDVVKRSG